VAGSSSPEAGIQQEAIGYAAEGLLQGAEYGVNSLDPVTAPTGFGGIDTQGNGESFCPSAGSVPRLF